MMNKNLVLVCGKSATGKTASLRNLKNPEGVVYLNCEAGKEISFPAKFKQIIVTDALQVPQAFEEVEPLDYHTIVVDSLGFLMDMYETQYVLTSTDGRRAWGEYAQFFKRLMQQHVAASSKNVIFTAHTSDILNESEMVVETMVKVKGALMNQGIESYFSHVIASKKMPIKKLDGFTNPMLDITEDEEQVGFKYLFQTRLTKETVNERIRAPIGMWPKEYTFVDNDLQKVLDHVHKYYKP